MLFDYKPAADRAGIARDKLERLAAIMRAEHPDDETMAELHILRAVLAVRELSRQPVEIPALSHIGQHRSHGESTSA